MTKRILLTLLFIIIGLLSVTGMVEKHVIGKTDLKQIDNTAQAYYDKTFKHALYTYGIVRGMNAVISVIQESEIALTPAGMGINLAVGEILDPLNDLIERFSWICLAAATSLGIQKMLLTITAWLGFSVLLSAAMLVMAVSLWISKFREIALGHLGLKLIVVALLLRYGLPFSAWATSRIDVLFFEETRQEASTLLAEANSSIQNDNNDLTSHEKNSFLHKFKDFFKNIDRAVQLEARVRKLKSAVSGYTKHIVDLIIIFILQTLLLPVAMLYLLLRLMGWLLNLDLIKLFHFKTILRVKNKNKILGAKT